jgi:polyketide biosynthesis enoyl-CoA hydratase PksI
VVRVNADGTVLRVVMDDITSANAFTEEMVRALTGAFAEAERRSEIRAVLLAAEGEVFSAGAPRALLEQLASGAIRPTDILLPRLLLCCPVPVVAAMAGHATGGGLALGLSADIVLMADESRYGFPFMDLGFTPGMGSTVLCEHVLSPAVAHELLFTGEMRRGRDFARTGVNHVLPRVEVLPRAIDLVDRIATKPRAAVEALKRTLSLPRRRAFEHSLTTESLMHQITFGAAGAAQGIRDGYVE